MDEQDKCLRDGCDMDEQDKCSRDGCDTPIIYGGVWGYCSEECLELEEGTDKDVWSKGIIC